VSVCDVVLVCGCCWLRVGVLCVFGCEVGGGVVGVCCGFTRCWGIGALSMAL
jgi:hypothetical protein